MYKWCSHTFNIIKGVCPHNCNYCYLKRFPIGPLRFDEKELKTNLGRDNTIFVGSSCDMFAHEIPQAWIIRVLEYCRKYPDNHYVFQTKNPLSFIEFRHEFPPKTLLGVTLETNRETKNISHAPNPQTRANDFKNPLLSGFSKFVSVEPVLDFDVESFAKMIQDIHPSFVSIGADSKNHGLNEPSATDIKKLLQSLIDMDIKIKDNLRRLTGTWP